MSLGTEIVGQLLEIPLPEDNSDPPPTDGERMLVRLFSCDQMKFAQVRQGGLILASWIGGKLSRELRDALLGNFGAVSALTVLSSSPQWQRSVDIVLNPSNPFFQRAASKEFKLMGRAFQQKERRWKFLTLYQVLEHGFLLTLLDALNDKFLTMPQQAIDEADEALKNDLTRFVELINGHSLKDAFDDLETNFTGIKTSNRFAAALERQWEKRTHQVPNNQKGAFICYKVRCAIVHAGDSIMYEAYPDADGAVTLMLDSLERAVIKYLGITIQ